MDRFWVKVNKTDTCWLWTACKNKQGYGCFNLKGKRIGAHRVAWEMEHGPIPEGMWVDHLCFNGGCVNPAHMRLATRKQNQEHRKGAQSNSKTGIRGVSWHKQKGKWRAVVKHHSKNIHLGLFERIEDAEVAAIAARAELFTHDDLQESKPRL